MNFPEINLDAKTVTYGKRGLGILAVGLGGYFIVRSVNYNYPEFFTPVTKYFWNTSESKSDDTDDTEDKKE